MQVLITLQLNMHFVNPKVAQNVGTYDFTCKEMSSQFFHLSRYFPSIKKLLTNKSFMIMFFFVGGAMGYISTISTKIEQVSTKAKNLFSFEKRQPIGEFP